MPIIPDFVERLGLRLNLGTPPMLDVLAAGSFRTVVVAVRLGVFDALGGSSLTPSELAARTMSNEDAIRLLLGALEPLGYIRREGERYANTAMAKKWMLNSSPYPFRDVIEFWEYVLEAWSRADDSIRRGGPQQVLEDWLSSHPEGWRIYQSAMLAYGRYEAEAVVNRLMVPPGARQLIDLGGGHGIYAMKLCQKHPELSASIFDRKEALSITAETAVKEGVSEHITTKEGDFLSDDIGSGYDIALLFGSVHQYSSEVNTKTVKKIASALNPKGLLVIKDEFSNMSGTTTARAWLRFQGLNYFAIFGGRTYSTQEVFGWLRKGGFGNLRWVKLPRTVSSLVLATKAT